MKSFLRVKFYQGFTLSIRWFSVESKPNILESARPFKGRRTRTLEKGKITHEGIPIISCKNETLNHYKGQTYNRFVVVPLASKGWHHRKAKGDFFEIKNYGDVPGMETSDQKSFKSLGISDDIIQELENLGITHPSNVQAEGIKHILEGRNTLLAAETGSGKTLAYLLPLLIQIRQHQLNHKREKLNSPFALIISPSRELTHQIGGVARLFCEKLGINVEVVTGGRTKKMIMNPTFQEVDLLVASLGALSKLITTGIYRTLHTQHVVLDEADTLLDDSFNARLLYVLNRFSFTPSSITGKVHEKPCIQMIMASATIPTSMDQILGETLPVDTLHKVTTKHLHCFQRHVPQKFLRLGRSQKPSMLLKLVKASTAAGEPVLIFSNKSSTCDWISLFLNEMGVMCTNLNGDMYYQIRLGKFLQFQTGEVNVLSSTDMASRGLDTVRVKHLINYDFPVNMADYIHRCGRTGRIGSPENCHITHFVAGQMEIDLVHKIELAVRRGEPLPNVNGNIRRIIEHRYNSRLL